MFDTHFILVRPGVSENIGASARAIKTMGFHSLRLVDPRTSHLTESAYLLAHGAFEILENIRVFDTLEEATHDCDLVIGSTAKSRVSKKDHYPVDRLSELLKDKERILTNVAIVFGAERTGLNRQEVELCDLVSGIPMKAAYPSVNLSQAVMIYAYSLANLSLKDDPETLPVVSEIGYSLLKSQIRDLLERLAFNPDSSMFRRMMERLVGLKDIDARLLLSVIKRIQSKF